MSSVTSPSMSTDGIGAVDGTKLPAWINEVTVIPTREEAVVLKQMGADVRYDFAEGGMAWEKDSNAMPFTLDSALHNSRNYLFFVRS